ncbi:MAG: hypothetical protein IAG10_20655 [Planctomycetaceae bacterium]|nr:hypothetical protein [Planctomycetaceae bacterium]
MPYRCVAHSRDGFVHYLVTSLICRGYWFYVTGWIPEGKDAESIDRKLIAKYDCAISKAARWRRKKLGKANVQYLRCGRFFMLIATKGEHQFFREEASVRDIRKIPLKFGGYSISFRRDGHLSAQGNPHQRRVHVRIEESRFRELLADFEHHACRASAECLANRFYQLPYQGYAPVRRQLCTLLRFVNRRRQAAGLTKLPTECLHLFRRIERDHHREITSEAITPWPHGRE